MAVDYKEEAKRRAAARYAGLLGRQDEMSAIPQNSLFGSISSGLESARDFGNKATVPDFIPYFGGTGVGDMIVGQSPEEVENWSYGNSPFDMPYQGTGGLLPRIKPNRQISLGDTLLVGADLTGVSAAAKPLAKAAIKGATPKAQEMLENTMRKTGLLSDAAPSGPRSVSDYGFDDRYGGTKTNTEKVKNLQYKTEQVGDLSENVNDTISIIDLANAGTPFITPMADRSDTAQLITEFKGVKLSRPVHLQGGQDYGFQMEGAVYANDPAVSKKLMEYAQYMKSRYGVDPVLMPHTMTPSGSDFATFSPELQMSWAYETLGSADKKRLDDLIKNKGFDVSVSEDIPGQFNANGDPKKRTVTKNFRIPDWAGINDSRSIEQMRNAPAELRKAIVTKLGANRTVVNADTAFGQEGLLSASEIRAGVSDMDQLNAIDGAFRNIGIMDLTGKITPSDHYSYPTNLPGEMRARLLESNITPYDIPGLITAGSKESGMGLDWVRQAIGRKDGSIVDPHNLIPNDQRSLNLNMVGGRFDENTLRYLENQGLLSKF
jgi:hypothetical protein